MFILTHMRLAALIYDQLSPYEQMNIDRNWFVYGNVEPDFSRAKKCFKHYEDVAMKMIEATVLELDEHSLTKKDYSLQLGVLCHFICDVFCLYHQEAYRNKNPWQHFLYEYHLHMQLEKRLFSKEAVGIEEEFLPIQWMTNPIDIIMARRKTYAYQTDSYNKDLNAALDTMKRLIRIYEKNMIALHEYNCTNIH